MQPAETPALPCPWCRRTDTTAVWPGGQPDDCHLRRCNGCDLTFTAPPLSTGQLASCYGEAYYGQSGKRFNQVFEALVRWFRGRLARRISRYSPPGRVLDIGCGRGLTLAQLRQQGWQVQGVELNDSAARYAREVLGLEVLGTGFDPAAYPPGCFDAVILWHVLEHLDDVRRVLEGVARLLKSGGLLVLAVPNFSSWQARWTRYRWFHLDLPRHRYHFSGRWLSGRLKDLGFLVLDECHTSLEQNPYGWVQSLLNCCGLRHNLLYDMLRQPTARNVAAPWSQYPVQSICSLLGFVLLLPVGLLMLIAEGLFKRGGTVEIIARRVEKPALRVPG